MIIKKSKQSKFSFHKKDAYRRGALLVAKDFPSSLKYAVQGLIYAFSSQRNFRIQSCIGLLVLFLSIWLKLTFVNCAILFLTISTVLALELINTSIEAVVDLAIGKKFYRLARIAKDCAAASVLIGAFSSCFIALFILLPPILQKLGF